MPGTEHHYEVSVLGGVRRLKPSRGKVPGPLRLKLNPDGYQTVCLSVSKRVGTFKVHHLVAAAFIGPCPDGQEVNHKNGVKHDNRAENLEYLTHQANVVHGLNLPDRKKRMARRAQARADSGVCYVTYNYSLSASLASKLADVCERTERSASDIVRQLMLEFVEGDRQVLLSDGDDERTVRSSLRLRRTTLKAFEAEVAARGHPGKAVVLEALLRAFLDRSPKVVERVQVTLSLPVSAMQWATRRAADRALSLNDFLAEVIQSNIEHQECAKKES